MVLWQYETQKAFLQQSYTQQSLWFHIVSCIWLNAVQDAAQFNNYPFYQTLPALGLSPSALCQDLIRCMLTEHPDQRITIDGIMVSNQIATLHAYFGEDFSCMSELKPMRSDLWFTVLQLLLMDRMHMNMQSDEWVHSLPTLCIPDYFLGWVLANVVMHFAGASLVSERLATRVLTNEWQIHGDVQSTAICRGLALYTLYYKLQDVNPLGNSPEAESLASQSFRL